MQETGHSFFSDPEKLGIIAYLTAGITLFLRNTVMLTATHNKIIEKEQKEKERERSEKEKWQQAAFDLLRTGKQLVQTTQSLVQEEKRP